MKSKKAKPSTEIKAKIGRPAPTTQRIYFCGGGLPKSAPLNIPAGWQLSSDKRPSEAYELSGVSAFRLSKDSEYIRLYRYTLRPSVLDSYQLRRERIRLQRLALDNAEIFEADRKLLAAKNAATGTPAKRRGKKKRRVAL